MEILLSLHDAQKQLGIKSRKTLLKFIKRGDLRAFKLGGTRWRVANIDLKRFLSNQQMKEFAEDIENAGSTASVMEDRKSAT